MTTTFDANGITLNRIREFVWEIPREGEMRVPARVLASESLLEQIGDDLTLTQLKNTTHLPGIRKHAICMPDGHQGYGFPVGGVAGIDTEEGVISPGAVGYDINCVTGDTEVQLEFGRRVRLSELQDRFVRERAVVKGDREETAEITLLTETEDTPVYEVRTTTGFTVKATRDHEFLTPRGMVALGNLEPGDEVFVQPFIGVTDEDPPEFTVLDESDFSESHPDIVRVLREHELLPLTTADDAFHRLVTLVGYHTVRGSFNRTHTVFYGEQEDLKELRTTIEQIGFTASRIHECDRSTLGAGFDSTAQEAAIRVTAPAFKHLLIALGRPTRDAVTSEYTLPGYLGHLTDWQKALYLSSVCGAAMTAPARLDQDTPSLPSITHIRCIEYHANGEDFMRGLIRLFKDLGVHTTTLRATRQTLSQFGEASHFRFEIEATKSNLRRFLTRIGYRYNNRKQREGVLAAQYLSWNRHTDRNHVDTANGSWAIADGGRVSIGTADHDSPDDPPNRSELDRKLIERDERPIDFRDFDTFRAKTAVKDNLAVSATIEEIRETGRETVYDIGVAHDAHNFVANGFVVSNCGVRMVKTNLTYEDVHGHEEELVEALFERVPSGLGGGGVLESDIATVEEILDRGMDWALEHGYAIEDDLRHCEDEGEFHQTDHSKVSSNAKNRGKNQIGSLGSGNHFLEVQRVTDVFRDDVAAAFGVEENQVVVLIHCGSRGLGHQICTDYLRKIEKTHAGLLAQLPDKELAAAPADSQLATDYYLAMGSAINYAWVNRQLVMHGVRNAFESVFETPWEDLGMELLYDVAHNIAKKEVHAVEDGERELFVHRKGATRAFPAGRSEVPATYRDVGQPIIIPGSMGTGSYVLRGGQESMRLTFGSTAHGAGRVMSRTQAKKTYWGGDVQTDLREQQQIYVKAASGATIAEEAPGVYKDVDEVVRVSDKLGIGDTVIRTYPICNIKG